jgi:DNA-binding MarR family transcriptional regulator
MAELPLAQYELLEAIATVGAQGTGKIAEAAGVAAPTAARGIGALARKGLVERRPGSPDRRTVVVELTAEGKRLLGRRKRLVERKLRAIGDSLSEGERAQAAAVLRRLAEVIERL